MGKHGHARMNIIVLNLRGKLLMRASAGGPASLFAAVAYRLSQLLACPGGLPFLRLTEKYAWRKPAITAAGGKDGRAMCLFQSSDPLFLDAVIGSRSQPVRSMKREHSI